MPWRWSRKSLRLCQYTDSLRFFRKRGTITLHLSIFNARTAAIIQNAGNENECRASSILKNRLDIPVRLRLDGQECPSCKEEHDLTSQSLATRGDPIEDSGPENRSETLSPHTPEYRDRRAASSRT